MSDDTNLRGGQDRTRINLDQDPTGLQIRRSAAA